MRRFALAIAFLSLLAVPSAAGADSGGAKVSALPESSSVEVFAQVEHQCEGSCAWFATAAAYSASSGCPYTFDATHGVWQSPVEQYSIKTVGSFTVGTSNLENIIVVCLYVYSEGSTTLVGQSHPFNVSTGREILPPPPAPPEPPASPAAPEPSLKGLRDCEPQWPNGAYLDASPSVRCSTAKLVEKRLFENPCQYRTYCVVAGFRCYGKWDGRNRTFFYAHHASCRSDRRRIVLDIG